MLLASLNSIAHSTETTPLPSSTSGTGVVSHENKVSTKFSSIGG
jgi:hypothetical protein